MLLSNRRIFLIEDELKNLNMMQILLENHEARVSYERWGRDTISRLQNFAPVDIILLDLNFPNNVSGYDVFEAIREVPEFADVPIAAVSAMDPAEAVPKTRAKGFAGFISKPVNAALFPQQVAAIIAGRHIWDE